MTDRNLKVTDRRMFTPEGELRQEFQQFEQAETATPEEPTEVVSELRSAPDVVASPPHAAPDPRSETGPQAAMSDPPHHSEPEVVADDAPSFLELVRLLAEHASIYLTQVRTAPPQAASENLELARLHIDLLAVLKEKTRGNLSPAEQSMLDDATYQLRAGLVSMGG